MNVYNEAHNLAEAIKQAEEFKEYDRLRREIDADPEVSSMIHDFEQRQVEMQTKQMMGETVTQEQQENMQRLAMIVMQNPKAANYLQAAMRFSLMMSDVYKIIGEAAGIQMPNI